MTTTNREGPLLSVNKLRLAIRADMRDADWLNYYMADAEREEGIAEGTIQRPRSWQMPSERAKWPESQLPCLLIVVAGINGPVRVRGENLVQAPYGVEFGAVCRGIDDDDTWQIASVYGAALRAYGAKQLEDLSGFDIEGALWDDNGEDYSDLDQAQGRSLRMASLAFTLRINSVVSARQGVAAVPDPPLGDPGPYPAVSDVEINVDKMLD